MFLGVDSVGGRCYTFWYVCVCVDVRQIRWSGDDELYQI